VAPLAGVLAAGAVPPRRVWIVASATALGLAGVAVTFDRAAYLALCAAALVIGLLAAPRVRRAFLPAMAALVLLAALLARVRAREPIALGALAALTALLVVGQAHDVLYDTKVMYALWFALGLSLSPGTSAQSPKLRLAET